MGGRRTRELLGGLGVLGLGCASAVATVPAGGADDGSVAGALPVGLRVKQLALGDYHTCALLESGRVACWGGNGMGQLGNGSDRMSAVPAFVPGLSDVVEIRASRATTCVRMGAGTVSCWGDNAYGQANPRFDPALTGAPTPWGVYESRGEPSAFTPANVLRAPTANAVAAGARSVALGYGHACGLYEAGGVKCWGDASRGQLGVEAPGEAFQARPVTGLPPLVDLASALFYSCGRTAGGDVWCWGANDQTQLGNAAPGPVPRQVPGVAGAVALELEANRACARLDDGQVMCWGDSLDCGEDHPHGPALVANLAKSLQFVWAAGECFWCVLDSGHRLACEGDPIALAPFTLNGVSDAAAGNSHACAARADGSVWCWGSNSMGELGRKTAAPRDPDPAPVIWPAHMLENSVQ